MTGMIRSLSVSIFVVTAMMFAVIVDAATETGISVIVKDERGIPVSDAVVTVYPATNVATPIRFPWTNAMAQKNLQFVPGTLIVPKGSSVSFPNQDRVRHSVYSFSKAARFEINLYAKEQVRSHVFAIAGNVALGCNIHDAMRGYIKVVDTPFAAKTDRNGRINLTGVPTGGATVKIWHPKARSVGNETSHKTSLSKGVNDRTYTLAVRAD